MKDFFSVKKCLVMIGLVLVVALAYVYLGGQTKVARALSAPFGGMITSVAHCPCSANLAVTIGPPVGGIFTVDASTMLYSFYQIFRTGAWTVGTYTPGTGSCLNFCTGCCYPMLAPIGTINMVGTSM